MVGLSAALQALAPKTAQTPCETAGVAADATASAEALIPAAMLAALAEVLTATANLILVVVKGRPKSRRPPPPPTEGEDALSPPPRRRAPLGELGDKLVSQKA
jgi:hypothetical protein